MSNIVRSFANYMRHKLKLFVMCDPLAMAVAIDPGMVTESVHFPVCIALQGMVTRGQMVTIVKNTQGLDVGPKVEIVKQCRTESLAAMYEKATE